MPLPQLPKQKIILILGVILALLSIFMTKVYIDQERAKIRKGAEEELSKLQANQAAVLVAKQDIPRGAAVTQEMLESKNIPNQYIQPQAVTSFERIDGMMATTAISKGEQLTLTKLSYASKQMGELAEVTPMGKRAVTISVDNIASLGGMLKAGDYIDVIVMIPVPVETADKKQVNQLISIPLFQNVLILAVGQQTAAMAKQKSRYEKEEEAKVTGVSLITLALTPQEANLTAFAQEQGKFRLTLRSPADSKIEPAQPATWDTLLQYIAPQPKVKEEPQPPPTAGYVEIYRGSNKEKMPIINK